MTTMAMGTTGGGRPGSLYDVLELILDKGLVIDAFVRVSLVGIELLTIDARIVVASVDTYLHFAEAANRLQLGEAQKQGLPDLVGGMAEGGAKHKTKGALSGAAESIENLFDSDKDEDEDEDEERELQPAGRRDRGRSRRSSRQAQAEEPADDEPED